MHICTVYLIVLAIAHVCSFDVKQDFHFLPPPLNFRLDFPAEGRTRSAAHDVGGDDRRGAIHSSSARHTATFRGGKQ